MIDLPFKSITFVEDEILVVQIMGTQEPIYQLEILLI